MKELRTYLEIDPLTWVCMQDVTAVEKRVSGVPGSRIHMIGGQTLLTDAWPDEIMKRLAEAYQREAES